MGVTSILEAHSRRLRQISERKDANTAENNLAAKEAWLNANGTSMKEFAN